MLSFDTIPSVGVGMCSQSRLIVGWYVCRKIPEIGMTRLRQRRAGRSYHAFPEGCVRAGILYACSEYVLQTYLISYVELVRPVTVDPFPKSVFREEAGIHRVGRVHVV